jgi:hypothetical protein
MLKKLKRSMSSDAREFNNIETRALMKLFPSRQGAEGNSSQSDKNISGKCTIVCHRQNLGGQFKSDDVSTCDAAYSGRHKIVTTLEIID